MVVSQAPSPTAVTCGAYHNSLYTYYNIILDFLSQLLIIFALFSAAFLSNHTGTLLGVGGGGVGGVGLLEKYISTYRLPHALLKGIDICSLVGIATA